MEEDFDQEQEDQYFAYLLEIGAIEVDGVNEDGDILFKSNPEKMKEYAPEMYDMMMSDINGALLELFEAGLVEIQYTEDLEPMFNISPEGKKAIQKMGFFPLDEPDNK